jgi:hypothetical protein
MQSLDNLDKKKIPNYSLSLHAKREVKQLETFYKQGKIWRNTKTGRRERIEGGK